VPQYQQPQQVVMQPQYSMQQGEIMYQTNPYMFPHSM
jgi:hypothetical protein